jgi:hypothetical protein
MSADLLSRPSILVALVDANGIELTARVQARDHRDVYELTTDATVVGWAEYEADGTPIEKLPLAEHIALRAGARVRMHVDGRGRVRLAPEVRP